MAQSQNGTILRVKRPLDETPAEALVIHSKRARLDGPSEPSLFVLSGSTESKDDVEATLSRGKGAVKRGADVERLRERVKSAKYSEESQMKLDVQSDSTREYSVLDVLHPALAQSESKAYTYDLYIFQDNDSHRIQPDDVDRIYPFQSDFFSSYRDIGMKNPLSDSDDDTDEDSNDENHKGNEYPSTDDSIDEDDMVRVVQNMDLGNDLSSDEGEQDLVYSNTSGGVNSDDVDRYGPAYAKYKAKILKDLNDPSAPALIEFDDSKASANDADDEDDFVYPKYDDDDVPSLIGSDQSDDEHSSEENSV